MWSAVIEDKQKILGLLFMFNSFLFYFTLTRQRQWNAVELVCGIPGSSWEHQPVPPGILR